MMMESQSQADIEAVAASTHDGTVLASVVSDDFAPGFILMERTLRQHNPTWTFPIIAVHSDIKPLSEPTKSVIREHCHNVHFAKTNAAAMAPIHDYAREVIKTPERLFPAFSVLEILRWSFFKRVIAIDSDVIIRGSLEPLLHTSAPFSAVRARHSSTDAPQGYVNTGLMVFDETMLKGFDFAKIRSLLGDRKPKPGTGKADQAILNILLHNATIGYLPQRFNYTKRSLMMAMTEQGIDDPTAEDADTFLTEEDVRLFHYVGEKPWNPKVKRSEDAYQFADTLWLQAMSEHGEKSVYMLMDMQRRVWQDSYTKSVERARARKTTNARAFERMVSVYMGL